MKKFDVKEAVKLCAYMQALADLVDVPFEVVELDVMGPDEIVVKIEASPRHLGLKNISTDNFDSFCTEHGVDGHVTLFNTSGTVTFSTSFKVGTVLGKDQE